MKQDKVTLNHKTIVSIFIVYEINVWPFKQSADFTLLTSLIGGVKLTKNADFDKYKYSGYVIEFNKRGSSSLSNYLMVEGLVKT